jgi:putative ABC transport system permease protein
MIPVTNVMVAAGIVSLPGMMTGQILAGAPPLQAVAYQVVVMLMIAAATAIGSAIVAFAAARRLVTADGRLEADRVVRLEKEG